MSGVKWIGSNYSLSNQKGYSGLLTLPQKNNSLKKIMANLVLPFSRKMTPGLDHDRFEFHLLGITEIRKSGEYFIGTESDDGSWIWIDGKLILDNGGLHGRQEKKKLIYLNQGNYFIEIKFTNFAEDAFLDFFWAQPDGTRVPISIKCLNPPKVVIFSSIIMTCYWISLISNKIAIYSILVLISLFMYNSLFPSPPNKKA